MSLILYAEHEFNASTFVVRVAASTLTDLYSAVTAAIGTLKGSLHGGANEAALAMISRFRDELEVDEGITGMLGSGTLVPGFGHRIYRSGDPRSPIIKEMAGRLAAAHPDDPFLAIAEEIEATLATRKRLFPNLDLYSAVAYHYCGIAPTLATPLFVLSRTSGWLAHFAEQQSDNRLIRPNASYSGPRLQHFVPLGERI